MQVILLAAGQSTRLDPISDKNMLEFCGKPLIEHQVAALKKAKLRDIVIVANQYNIENIKAVILKKYKNVIIVEQKKLEDGQAGGVLAGSKIIKHKNVLVMSTNDVFEPDLFEQIIKISKQKVDGVIVGKKMNTYFPGGYLKIDKNDFITDIIEKPGEGKEPSKFVNLICHIFNDFPAFASHLKKAKSKKDDLYEVALDQYIKKDKAKILTFKYNSFWQPIKYPWHVIHVMNYFLNNQKSKIDKTAKIAKTAIINGNVVIGPDVKIFDHATIQGPAYIGQRSIIANNALVRGSMIGNNCVVGFATEVARSYLNHSIWTHSNYIGDSVVDSNVSFGAGTVLGNLRFDEKNIKINIKKERLDSGTNKFGAIIGNGVRFGINASTNPGVKIGYNSFIGGSVLVAKDTPNNKVILLKQQYSIINNKTKINNVLRKKII